MEFLRAPSQLIFMTPYSTTSDPASNICSDRETCILHYTLCRTSLLAEPCKSRLSEIYGACRGCCCCPHVACLHEHLSNQGGRTLTLPKKSALRPFPNIDTSSYSNGEQPFFADNYCCYLSKSHFFSLQVKIILKFSFR